MRREEQGSLTSFIPDSFNPNYLPTTKEHQLAACLSFRRRLNALGFWAWSGTDACRLVGVSWISRVLFRCLGMSGHTSGSDGCPHATQLEKRGGPYTNLF